MLISPHDRFLETQVTTCALLLHHLLNYVTIYKSHTVWAHSFSGG